MNPKEVIDIIEDVTWEDHGRHYGKINSAREMSIKALKKLIPKKPLNVNGRYCAVCGASVNSFMHKFCHKCGQAIDWSDSNGNS